MDAKTADRVTNHPLGALVAEGKTKKIHQVSGSADLVILVSKDDITAGDGAKHDIVVLCHDVAQVGARMTAFGRDVVA